MSDPMQVSFSPVLTQAVLPAASDEALQIRHEHDKLSQQASNLSNVLARRRADLALMRAEAATVALSLESAKHSLDNALRNENVIRAGAPSSPLPSPHARTPRADFLPDAAFARALAGQLDVTRASVAAAAKRRDSLLAEIAALRPQPVAPQPAAEGDVPGKGMSLALPQPVPADPLTPLLERRVSSRDAAEHAMLHLLEEGVSSRSSFRLDHARIWRDVTMPNLVLVDRAVGVNGQPAKRSPRLKLGVVTERIFEGITCFTPTTEYALLTSSRSSSSPPSPSSPSAGNTDLRIESYSPVAHADTSLCHEVTKEYAVLSAHAVGDTQRAVRIIATRVALERVCSLVSDACGRGSGGWRPSPRLGVAAPPFSTGAAGLDHAVGDALDQASSVALDGKGSPSNLIPTGPCEKDVTTDLDVEDAEHTTKAFGHEDGKSSINNRNNNNDTIVDTNHMPPLLLRSPRRSDSSTVLNDKHFAHIMANGVPIRFHESTLNLVYSTDVDGMSLRTLYNRVKTTWPTLIAIRDTKGGIFGCYGAHGWKSSATRYYGSGESFVFGTVGKDMVQVYKWSRKNSFFQFTSSNFLAIGGGAGSHFALWVDEDLFMGTTSTCSTFDSPPLTNLNGDGSGDSDSCTEFKIVSLEVWAFGVRR